MNSRSRIILAYLGGGDDGEGVHDPVGVFLADLGDEQGAHAGAGAAAQGVGQLGTKKGEIFR